MATCDPPQPMWKRNPASGHKRRFDPQPVTSGLARSTDIIRSAQLVRVVPNGDLPHCYKV